MISLVGGQTGKICSNRCLAGAAFTAGDGDFH
jgi:hypothetical protein